MASRAGEDPPPESADIEGWRRAVDDGRYRQFRMEDVVAAIQDLGPKTDKRVLNPLAEHLSDALMGILRSRVHSGHPNEGWDIIERTHDLIIRAVLNPRCLDGKGLRVAFVPRVDLRIKDALITEERAAWKPGAPAVRPRKGTAGGKSEPPAPRGEARPTSYDPSSRISENMDVESVLQLIPDGRKRLAFRLFMDDVPYKSKKTRSIASALGIEEKTAREWIKEVQALLSTSQEVQDLIESRRAAP